jgi:hypothetical protein
MPDDVDPGHLDLSGVRPDERGQDPDRRRLPCPVGAEESADRRPRHLEIHAVENRLPAVPLDQPSNSDRRRHQCLRTLYVIDPGDNVRRTESFRQRRSGDARE